MFDVDFGLFGGVLVCCLGWVWWVWSGDLCGWFGLVLGLVGWGFGGLGVMWYCVGVGWLFYDKLFVFVLEGAAWWF